MRHSVSTAQSERSEDDSRLPSALRGRTTKPAHRQVFCLSECLQKVTPQWNCN